MAAVATGTADRVVVGSDGNPRVEPGDVGIPIDEVPAAGAYLCLECGRWIVDAELISALDDFDAGLLGEAALST